jgi:hypothetical protein
VAGSLIVRFPQKEGSRWQLASGVDPGPSHLFAYSLLSCRFSSTILEIKKEHLEGIVE